MCDSIRVHEGKPALMFKNTLMVIHEKTWDLLVSLILTLCVLCHFSPYNSKYSDMWIKFHYMHYIFELSFYELPVKSRIKKKKSSPCDFF